MVGTVENTNNNIWTKINAISSLIEHLDLQSKRFERCVLQFEEVSREYEMGSIAILSEYFVACKGFKKAANKMDKKMWSDAKNKQFAAFRAYISEENIIPRINRVHENISTIVKKKNIDDDRTRILLKLFNSSTIVERIKSVNYETCQCGEKMTIYASISALVCRKCGVIKELDGTVFEDEQFYYQEGQRTKHGTYDPSKHCRFWVERIQARESTEIPAKLIETIKVCIRQDKIKNKIHITCVLIRKYLHYTGNSKYNEHVPLIRKIITGITPPQLTDYEMQLIHIYFDKVIRIFDEIKPKNKANFPYHPYFIYKIIEQILKKPSDRIRKKKILECIHLQSRETLIGNDQLWSKICDKIDKLTYKPTDRNDQYNF